jgi:hypothetical protein
LVLFGILVLGRRLSATALAALRQLNREKYMNAHSKSEKFWDRIAKYFDWVEKKD